MDRHPDAGLTLSVVIPVHNGAADLRQCLQGLYASRRRPDEVIVVDDGSTDDISAVAASFPCRVLALEAGPRGPASARNHGALSTHGDVLVFLDADVVPHADTLALIEQRLLEEPACDALFGSYDDAPPEPRLASRYRNLLHHFVHQHGQREASTFWAGCGAIRRDVFETQGGFDESFVCPSIEDIELGMWLRSAGGRILLCPEIQVTHLKRWTLRTIWTTDVFRRALPWSRLLVARGESPRVLNIDRRSQLTAALAWFSIATALMALAFPAIGLLSLGSFATLLWLQRRALLFFRSRGGWVFMIGATALYLAYFLYSSAVYAFVRVEALLRGRSGIRLHRV